MRALGATRRQIEQEVSAITALGHGADENVIQILRHGWLDPEESVYFIDMELCDRNLSEFIMEPLDWTSFSCVDHPEYLRDKDPPIWWRTSEIMRVNFQLVNGTEYIHRRDMVHRDLKPTNGIHLSWPKVDISSPLLS
jgi:serine/threonine protein kinase